ncbi:MAG: pyruvate kinase [Promethearchaeota archaeon]
MVKVYLSADPGYLWPDNFFYRGNYEVRLNTGASITRSKRDIIEEAKKQVFPAPLWIDLKCRELRIIKEVTIPEDFLELNHSIEVDTPAVVYYNEGKNYIIIEEIIDRNKLKVKLPNNFSGNEKIQFGKGASINIPDKSLKIEGYLTSNDIEYIEAAKENGVHKYLLSYVESLEDIQSVEKLDSEAIIIAKIESIKGLKFVREDYYQVKDHVRLLTAREDLYIELERPHQIIGALKLIIQKDPDAIAASRILESLKDTNKMPNCAELCDIGYLFELGYKNLLLGDKISSNQQSLLASLGIINAITKEMQIK